MIFLKNDYSLGAHPKVLQALTDTNMTLTDGYGIDPFCDGASRFFVVARQHNDLYSHIAKLLHRRS